MMLSTVMQTIILILAFIGAVTVICVIGLTIIFFTVYRREIIIPVDEEHGRYRGKRKKERQLTIDDLIN